MSRRELIRMSDAEIDAYLQGRHTMNVGTYNHDGTIHLVAMWYGFKDGLLAFETFTKSQKIRNLERDPRITVLIDSGETYDQLQGVEVVGTASLYADPADVIPVAANIVQRYMAEVTPEQVDEVAQMMARKRTIVVVNPERVVSWDHRKLGGGY